MSLPAQEEQHNSQSRIIAVVQDFCGQRPYVYCHFLCHKFVWDVSFQDYVSFLRNLEFHLFQCRIKLRAEASTTQLDSDLLLQCLSLYSSRRLKEVARFPFYQQYATLNSREHYLPPVTVFRCHGVGLLWAYPTVLAARILHAQCKAMG